MTIVLSERVSVEITENGGAIIVDGIRYEYPKEDDYE